MSSIILIVVGLWAVIWVIFGLLALKSSKEKGLQGQQKLTKYAFLAGPFTYKATKELPDELPKMLASSTPIHKDEINYEESFDIRPDLPGEDERPKAPPVLDDVDMIASMLTSELVDSGEFDDLVLDEAPDLDSVVGQVVNIGEGAEDTAQFIEAEAIEEDEEHTPKSKSALSGLSFKNNKKSSSSTLNKKNKDTLTIRDAQMPVTFTSSKCSYCKQQSYSDWHGLCVECHEIWI